MVLPGHVHDSSRWRFAPRSLVSSDLAVLIVFGLARLALHAASLAFRHPMDGRPVEVHAPVPDDLRTPLERLGIADALVAPTP